MFTMFDRRPLTRSWVILLRDRTNDHIKPRQPWRSNFIVVDSLWWGYCKSRDDACFTHYYLICVNVTVHERFGIFSVVFTEVTMSVWSLQTDTRKAKRRRRSVRVHAWTVDCASTVMQSYFGTGHSHWQAERPVPYWDLLEVGTSTAVICDQINIITSFVSHAVVSNRLIHACRIAMNETICDYCV